MIDNERFTVDGEFIRLANGTVISKGIPLQSAVTGGNNAHDEALSKATEALETGVTALMGANFTISLLVGASLSMVWGLVHSLEMVAAFYLLNLRQPQNAQIVYEMIYNVANFSMMPSGWIENLLAEHVGDLDKSIEAEEELSATASLLDTMTAQNPITNMYVFVNGLIVALATGLAALLLVIACGKTRCAKNQIATMKKAFIWSFFLRLLIENFLDLGITNMLRLYRNPDFDNWFESTTSVVAIVLIAVVAVFPFACLIFLCIKVNEINEEQFQDKWGTLAGDLRAGDRTSVAYMPFFLIRRVGMSLTIVFLASFGAI